jgi:hypothetical protein
VGSLNDYLLHSRKYKQLSVTEWEVPAAGGHGWLPGGGPGGGRTSQAARSGETKLQTLPNYPRE